MMNRKLTALKMRSMVISATLVGQVKMAMQQPFGAEAKEFNRCFHLI